MSEPNSSTAELQAVCDRTRTALIWRQKLVRRIWKLYRETDTTLTPDVQAEDHRVLLDREKQFLTMVDDGTNFMDHKIGLIDSNLLGVEGKEQVSLLKRLLTFGRQNVIKITSRLSEIASYLDRSLSDQERWEHFRQARKLFKKELRDHIAFCKEFRSPIDNLVIQFGKIEKMLSTGSIRVVGTTVFMGLVGAGLGFFAGSVAARPESPDSFKVVFAAATAIMATLGLIAGVVTAFMDMRTIAVEVELLQKIPDW